MTTKKAHKINPNVLHPGNNKQDASRALAIFHETTSAAKLFCGCGSITNAELVDLHLATRQMTRALEETFVSGIGCKNDREC